MSIHLYRHNEDAYTAVETMLKEKRKAAVIHPTGTGKSLIAFRLAEAHPDKQFLWLSPSRYIYSTQLENINTAFPNVEYLSYSRLMNNENLIDTFKPDYIVLDEFHRCGAAEWGKSVRKLIDAYPDAKLLGLSATNIRYLDNQRNMAEEIFDGCIASEMTLGEAMARGILPTPIYVMAMYDYDDEISRLEKKIAAMKNQSDAGENEKLLEQLKRALAKADGMPEIFKKHMSLPRQKKGRYLVFCRDISHMDEMAEKAAEWFKEVDSKPHIYKAYYNNPQTGRAFADFKADNSEHLKLLYCIDMLNEGVHVDDIDGVILLRPTISPIIYLQQIGRCLSAGKNSSPVIFDMVDNFESLHGIDYLKTEIEQAFDYMHATYEKRAAFSFRFEIYDEVRESRELFEKLQENISSTWESYYEAAKEYFEENGSLKIAKSYVTDRGLKLGAWIQTQRKVYAGKTGYELSQEKIDALNAIGMVWSARADSMETAFAELEKYYNANHSLDIKARYVSPSGYPLGRWVNNLRVKVNKKGMDSVLTDVQQKKLSDMGMIWKKNEEVWDVYIEAARTYKEQHGNLRVPVRYRTTDGLQLGKWMANIRNKKKNPDGSGVLLDDTRMRQMESIGMEW